MPVEFAMTAISIHVQLVVGKWRIDIDAVGMGVGRDMNDAVSGNRGLVGC